MIQLRGVTKRYDGLDAVKDLDLQIPAGAVTALIGPSGCGKSTILRLILGLLEPTSGRVVVGGVDVSASSALMLRRSVGYVIQDGGLFPHLTASQNVRLMPDHIGKPVDMDGLAELTRLPKEALRRFPGELSGGQRQRVGLMRALALDPKVLLLDEPLAALDPLIRSALQSDLKDIFAKLERTVVLVTHDMGEAAYLGHRIVLLRDGKVIQEGGLDEFRDRPAEPFVTEFLSAQRQMVAI